MLEMIYVLYNNSAVREIREIFVCKIRVRVRVRVRVGVSGVILRLGFYFTLLSLKGGNVKIVYMILKVYIHK